MTSVTFDSVLHRQKDFFVTKVDTSHGLLDKLEDSGVLERDHVKEIQALNTDRDKNRKLYDILLLRDDKLLDAFFVALEGSGQQHVVRKLRPPADAFSSKLKAVVEPDYGFPSNLFWRDVITKEAFDDIRQIDKLRPKVEKLLDITRENWSSDDFLQALEETNQSHVSNYIRQDGKNESGCDDWPLDSMHVKYLHCPPLVTDLTLTPGFMKLLVERKCLIQAQAKDVQQRGDNEQGREYLIRVMERRSIGNYNWFMACVACKQDDKLVQKLKDMKVLAEVITSIERVDAEQCSAIENEAIARCNELVQQLSAEYPFRLVIVRMLSSLHWYFNCKTVESLKHLRKCYESGELLTCLEKLLADVIATFHDGRDGVSMKITWSDEDYQDCLQYLTSSQPDELQTKLSVNMSVEVMEVILAKAAVLLFKNEEGSCSQGVFDAALVMILTVCRLWLLVLSSEQAVKRLRNTVCRFPVTLHHEYRLRLPERNVVWGDVRIAVLDDSLFIARGYEQTIDVCNLTSSELIQTIKVDDLVIDVVACSVTQRVYLATLHRRVLFFEWKSSSQSTTSPLNAYEFIECDGYEPCSLSVTRRQQLLVAGVDYEQQRLTMVLYLYSENGELVQRVQLPDNGVETLLLRSRCHAAQNANDNFIVCRSGWTEDALFAEVAEYDSNGLLVRSFDNSGRLFEQPCYLMLDLDGHVLVADRERNSVVLLNSSLELVRVLLSRDQLTGDRPIQLCYRAQTRHLFVAGDIEYVGVYSVINWISLTTRFGPTYSKQIQSMTEIRPLHYSSSHRSKVLQIRPAAGDRFDWTLKELSVRQKTTRSDVHSDYSSSQSTNTVESQMKHKSILVTTGVDPEKHFEAAETSGTGPR